MIVALTHSADRFEGLSALLGSHGLTVLHAPLVQSCTVRDANLTPLETCAWWSVTSRATVSALRDLNASFEGKRFAAIGFATARDLEHLGANVALIAPQPSAASLAHALLEGHPDVHSVGFPCGERALPTLARLLEAAGVELRRVIVYRTITQPWRLEVQPDLILLASPSAVSALPESVAQAASLVALGETTAAAVHARGLDCTLSLGMSIQAVTEAILRARDRHARSTRGISMKWRS